MAINDKCFIFTLNCHIHSRYSYVFLNNNIIFQQLLKIHDDKGYIITLYPRVNVLDNAKLDKGYIFSLFVSDKSNKHYISHIMKKSPFGTLLISLIIHMELMKAYNIYTYVEFL